MDIKYSKADYSDLDEVEAIIKASIRELLRNDIKQWDEVYPTKADFKGDIDLSSLYKGCIDGRIAVIFALNNKCEPDYQTAAWKYPDVPSTVLHRFIVHPDFQNRGIGRMTLDYIEKLLASQGIHALRLDAFSENRFSLAMYYRAGYNIVAHADWRMGHFYLMEKYF